MARQKSPFKFEGEIGDVIFFKSKDGGFMAREKSGVSADRIQKDPAYARLREHMSDFSRAGAASKLVRKAFRMLIRSKADRRVASRLTREFFEAVKADAVNDRGLRNVLDGELEILRGFEFNQNAPLDYAFPPPFTSAIDRAAGTLTVTVPAFNVSTIAGPQEATHFMLRAASAELDFETQEYNTGIAESSVIELGLREQPEITLVTNVPPASTRPLFLIFGIEFLITSRNGTYYPLSSGEFNAMQIVGLDVGV